MKTKKILFLQYILPLLTLFLFSLSYCFGSEESKLEIRSKINKGISLYKDGHNNEALPYLMDVIDSGISSSYIHYVVGEIYYSRNELQKAIKNWETSLKYAPSEAILAKIAKTKKELKLSEKQSDKISCNFVLQYDQDDTYSSELVLHSLVNEYNHLAYDFGWFNNSDFTVILYSKEDFTNILNVPSWAGGIYDGKIRIPFQYATLNIEDLESIIRHELTHAILHRIAGNNVPAWLHEGVAQYKDGVDDSAGRNILKNAVINNTLIPISNLKNGFVSIKDAARVKVAYAESLGFVEYLINNYGFYTILKILNNFSNYPSLDELFISVYNLDLGQLESEWIEQLKLENK